MDSEPRGHESSRRTHTDLKPLKTKCDVAHFLEAIREGFCSSVNLRESGLEDSLIQNGVLKDDSDVESLYHNHSSRKDKTRRLWFILHDVDHNIFINKGIACAL
ncbi:uncharacterized protein LOC112569263 [Pomacea canaliculata]|uniref:uncharacterized protein LOC112569263 n=1 Tax=Pomacea canaliculata TaxID=400727 RepID=UPI000D726605|nr:uncharacterized protein LOC112569263 [Pomacea canaliculata]